MIVAETSKGRFGIAFKHSEILRKAPVTMNDGTLKEVELGINRVTLCTLFKLEGEGTLDATAIGGGSTMCASCDNFCKETGRKIALTRALEAFPKEFKTEIWNAYWNRSERTAKNAKKAA